MHGCPHCGHFWRPTDTNITGKYYADLSGRNSLPIRYLTRKLNDRLKSLGPIIRNGMRILEVGCAEGALGHAVKALANVIYVGVEPSHDAQEAMEFIDEVHSTCNSLLADGKLFDTVLSFHVLEHIPDPASEIRNWRRLIAEEGLLVLEVPNRSGHPYVINDQNPEHIHQFSIASIACLLNRCGFDITEMSGSHFESPAYTDSIRILARPIQSETIRQESLVKRFQTTLGDKFAIYGLGGDFNNYILPFIDRLPIAALLDSAPQRQGNLVAGILTTGYAVEKHHHLPILIASIRYEDAIMNTLQEFGHKRQLLRSLADILDNRLGQ